MNKTFLLVMYFFLFMVYLWYNKGVCRKKSSMKYAYVLDALNSRTYWALRWKLTWIKSVHGQLLDSTNNKYRCNILNVIKLKLNYISLLVFYVLDSMFQIKISLLVIKLCARKRSYFYFWLNRI